MLCNVTISFKIGFDAQYVNIDLFTSVLKPLRNHLYELSIEVRRATVIV